MKHLIAILLALAAAAGARTASLADCGLDAGRAHIIGHEVPAILSVVVLATACASGTVTANPNKTSKHETNSLSGMTGNPAENTSAVVAGSSVVAPLIGARGIPGAALQWPVDDPELSVKASTPLTWIMPMVYGRGSACLLYTSPSPRDRTRSRMPSSA